MLASPKYPYPAKADYVPKDTTTAPPPEPPQPAVTKDNADDSKKPAKDKWDKLQILGAIIGAVAVPLVVIALGQWLTQSLKQGDTNARLIEVAVGVLKTDPKTTDTVPGLRNWAVSIINKYSELPLPEQSAKELLTKSLPSTSSRGEGCCVSCEGVTVCGRSVKLSCGSCEAANP